MIIKCGQCGNRKKVFPYQVKKSIGGYGLFCSRSCWFLFKEKNVVVSSETRKKMSEAQKIAQNLPEVKAKMSRVKTGFRHSEESKRKMSLARLGIKLSKETINKMSGSNNHRWKGGITSLNHKIRNCELMIKWRKSVFKRDNYICQKCGAKNSPGYRYVFNADHIKPFSRIIFENKITSFELTMICDELWDVDNGRTLCVDCHK